MQTTWSQLVGPGCNGAGSLARPAKEGHAIIPIASQRIGAYRKAGGVRVDGSHDGGSQAGCGYGGGAVNLELSAQGSRDTWGRGILQQGPALCAGHELCAAQNVQAVCKRQGKAALRIDLVDNGTADEDGLVWDAREG